MKRLRIGLGAKLALALVISTIVFFAVFGYLKLRLERRNFERLVFLNADRVSDIIQSSARHVMLRNDRESLYTQIRDIGGEPDVRRVRIFNKDGLISFSTDPKEVGHMVDKRAEACYACHAQEAPLTKLDRPDRARIFSDSDGQRVLAVIRPVENRPDCSSAACHAHPPDRRILGVIDAHLSLASVDEITAQHQAQFLRFMILAVILISMLSVVFVWLVVHRPIKELIAGTEKLSRGDLDYRLPVRSHDELGQLAASFNHMAAELAQAHAQLTEWARTLEERVRRKSEELQRAHTSLVTSEKMASIGKLAATVAHEVNNPLFGMLTYARLTLKALKAAPIDPSEKSAMEENLRIIERESRRCGDLMRNLLTFARQTPPSRSPNQINTVVERAVTLVRHKFELQELGLETDLSPELPPVSCDQNQVQQVLLTLLVNAAEAMGRGGRAIVSTRLSEDGAEVRVRVRDTGCGIPPEIQARIFEPFFSTKEEQHRTGLGLAIARSIVEQHGGAISVHSEPGQGTEFTVALPVEAPVAAVPGAPAENRKGIQSGGQPGK